MLIWGDTLFVVIAALAFDAVIGDPDWLWRRLPHPVTWFGSLIALLDRLLNRDAWPPLLRRIAGIATIAVLVAIAGIAGLFLTEMTRHVTGGNVMLALIASVFIAQRSLYQHVSRVRMAFASDGLAGARIAVSMIVGRDPDQLDEAAVSRAAIESAAENFSDGIVAPVFWLALLGLPGLLAYKAINTADSMIGHRSERYRWFGWAAARLDDLVNLVPARLSGPLIAVVAPVANGSVATSFRVMIRDAAHHRSPNAGWPESAMAGALGIALAGPRRYAEGLVNDPFLNDGARAAATPDDIRRALHLLVAACLLQAAIYAALALLL
ncbi:CobD/CbiB family cobalamin biosynthesis protein [Bradyrhizobium jicamae]|uniref:Cobalamin biosynthesis protein CobD n=1 Tax=Bradyrhizobium jicamae TaxID=280332 RepID=A0A0R3LTF5_9BRAD|nr:adenosylcobinamide-phosphate synthase CbiB [Bradyrhizobium jicamae]KRR11234.1 CobD/CbiB family cobalamin biosynthesis protein [Bradyrhizobium jicamae]